MAPQTFLVTGGAGFIGTHVVRYLLQHTAHHVVNLDKLTYAGNLAGIQQVTKDPSLARRYHFIQEDIGHRQQVQAVLARYQPDILLHLAAETHVDRSIDSPDAFMASNMIGTYQLLEAWRWYLTQFDPATARRKRFHHVSTDEVFGDLAGPDEATGNSEGFTETSPYAPSSPYSASKAGADHLVRAWYRTYKMNVVVTHCSNNYGPYQYPEKLIPLVIRQALAGECLPVYGDGQQVRDWLYVEDHARALIQVALQGQSGATYNIGGYNEVRNLDLVRHLCGLLDARRPAARPYAEQIQLVADRPGHDRRYAINAAKIARELGWQPIETWQTGLRKTVDWYLSEPDWLQAGWQRASSV